MIFVALLIVYIGIVSALIFGFTLAERKMSDTLYHWDESPGRAVTCAVFWPVCALPYVAYMAAIYYSAPRRKD